MKTRVGLVALLVFFTFKSSYPQVRGTGSDWFIDYFTANVDSQSRGLLTSVDINHTNKAINYIGNGRIDYASRELDYTLRHVPNHPRALQLIGVCAQLTKNSPLALKYYARALQLFPDYALTRAQYGNYLSVIGKMDEGIAELNRATEMDPRLLQAYVWLSSAYNKAGKPDLARQATDKAREFGYTGEIPGR